MNIQKKDPIERILTALNIGQVLFTIFLIYLAINQSVKDGDGSLNSWITGIVLAVIVVLFSLAVNKGSNLIENISDWLGEKLKIYPSFRRAFIIAPGVASAPLLTYWAITKIDGSFIEKLLVTLFFGLVLPAAIVSIAQDDRRIEKSPMAKYVSRETFTQNPQAAVAHAFTVVEDQLKKKLRRESSKGSDQIIGEAYGGGKNSRLMFIIDGKDHSPHLHNLLSGAFTLFRNSRHHSLVEDDEHTALTLYLLAGLLFKLIDQSEVRNTEEPSKWKI